jgi:hypothetical protein
MTPSDLRERVARAMIAKDSGPEGSLLFKFHWQEFAEGYLTSADAAIAIVLEEAAKVADEIKVKYPMDDGDYGHNGALEEAAAAIRALKDI